MKAYFTIIATLLSSLTFAQRDTIAINTGWQFAFDKNNEGVNQKWFSADLPDASTVTIPHTWNVEQGSEMYYGWAWYQKKFNIPSSWKNKNILLQFGAINHTSVIYVNGKKARENIGDGFNKFYINLRDNLKYGKENVITVAVNNDYGTNKVPYGSSFDWPNDGGIIRPVSLIVSGNPSANYIHAQTKFNVADNSGELKIKLGYSKSLSDNISFLVTVTEENQAGSNTIFSQAVKPVLSNTEAVADFTLPNVHPWNMNFPNLYRVNVAVMNKKKVVDLISTDVGFREIKFVDGKIFVNGEQIKLMGIEWTAGSNPNFGFAEPDSEIIRMGRLMKNVNCIFSRVHFPQSDIFYDFCDRNGILIQEEVPLWGPETPANDTIKNIAIRQLRTMVSNHYNHPSIMTWAQETSYAEEMLR